MMMIILYDLLFLVPLTAAVASFASPLYDTSVPEHLRLLTAVASAVYFVLIIRFRLRERIILLGLTVTTILAFIFYHPRGERLSFIVKHRWIASVALIALLCRLIFMFSEKIIHIRMIAAAAFIIISVVSLYTGYDVGKAAVLSMAFYILMTVVDLIQRRSNKDGDPDTVKHLVFTSPVFIILFAAISFISIPEQPYDWGFVSSISDAMLSTVARINDMFSGYGWDSDKPFIGFSDRGTLGGTLGAAGYKVMDIRSSTGCDPYLYLTGKVFDDFDGQNWTASDEASRIDPALDALETIAAVTEEKGDVPLSDLIRASDLTTKNRSARSMHRFLPLKTVSYSDDGNVTSRISYYRLNLTSLDLARIINAGNEITPEGWEAAKLECGLDSSSYDFESLEGYRQQIYRLYLPETEISGRAREAVDRVLSGSNSDYEKLDRIEKMLRKYRYSDSPGTLPGSIGSADDFLDYFMFEKKEGYCSYYATAFVLIARAYGIPARYVQGYRTDTGGRLNAETDSTDAHAWAEAYIEGFGWLIFEPTAGMITGQAANGWKTLEEMRQNESRFDPEHMKNVPDAEDHPDGTDTERHVPIRWSRIVLPALGGILFTLMLFAVDQMMRRRRFAKLSNHDKALWLCRRMMQVLKRKGLPRAKFETLSEYRARAEDVISAQYIGFLDTYERILYSDADVTDKDITALEEQINLLKSCPKTV